MWNQAHGGQDGSLTSRQIEHGKDGDYRVDVGENAGDKYNGWYTGQAKQVEERSGITGNQIKNPEIIEQHHPKRNRNRDLYQPPCGFQAFGQSGF